MYCDGKPNCPDGSDERDFGCSCKDRDLQECRMDEGLFCIPPLWIETNTTKHLGKSICDEAVFTDVISDNAVHSKYNCFKGTPIV